MLVAHERPTDDLEGMPAAIGPYVITGILGRGGMGVVYSGRHAETGDLAAVKTLGVADEITLVSIRREIHALGRVRHPGVVRILGSGILDGGLPWYAMELLRGRTLRGWLEDSWIAPSQRSVADREVSAGTPHAGAPRALVLRRDLLAVPRRLCETLGFLHGNGIVHRDLKPENIFVLPDGAPVLVDFGLASRFAGSQGREELEAGAAPIGTCAYMAPEQIRGELVDARADLYALGCILYECLAGRPPFDGRRAEAVLYAHLHERPVPPSQLVEDVPPELDEAVLALLEKQPQDRLGYASDVAHALEAPGDARVRSSPSSGQPYVYRPGFTGRVRAREVLDEAISRAAERRLGSTIFIGGESGVGKTRLAMEAVRTATRRKLAVVLGECAALGVGASAQGVKGAPLHPLAPLLLTIADRCRERGHAEAARLLGPRAKVLAAYQPALEGVPGYDGAPDPIELEPHAARSRVLDALVETLTAFAQVRPVLLVLDDLQWADDLTLRFLEALTVLDPSIPNVLVIGTYRMEETTSDLDAIVRAPRVLRIDLERFGAADVGTMVCGMLALRKPPMQLVDFLERQCNGNPFFIAEYLRAAIHAGVLVRDRAEWRFRAPDPIGEPLDRLLPLPGTLTELIELRLRTLRAKERALTHAASVLGRELDGDLLFEVARVDRAGGMDALEVLRRRQILEDADAGRLRFVHDKIREIAYERADGADRRVLHQRAGEAIEARSARSPDAFPSLGHHFAKAGLSDKACRYLTDAGDRARSTYANGDAVMFYATAIEQARQVAAGPAPDPTRGPTLTLHERLGDVLAFTGQQETARAAYADALGDAEPPVRARIHRKIGKTWEVRHDHERASLHYADAEAALGAMPVASGDWWQERVEISLDRLWVNYWMNRVDEMSVLVDQIRPVVDQHGTPFQRVRFFHLLAMRNIRVERYLVSADTVGYARAAVAVSEALPDIGEKATARFVLFFCLVLHGSFDEAERYGLSVLEAAERTGAATLRARCLTYLMMIARRRGHVEATRSRASQCLSASTAGRMDEYLGAVKANLAWIAWRDGDAEEAEQLAGAALELWRPQPICYPMQWLARWPLLAIEIGRGDVAEGVRHAEALLDARQQRLEPEVADPLESAIAALRSGAAPRAREALGIALGHARRLNYL